MEETCFICASPSSRIPFIGLTQEVRGSGNGQHEYESRWRPAFATFCKLLKLDQIAVAGEQDKGRFEVLREFALHYKSNGKQEKVEGVPYCCRPCSEVLADILKLQEVIDETKIAQRKLAKTLKDSLVKHGHVSAPHASHGDDNDFLWKRIRNELIDFCTTTEHSVNIATGHDDNITNPSHQNELNQTENLPILLDALNFHCSKLQLKHPPMKRKCAVNARNETCRGKQYVHVICETNSKSHLTKPCSVLVKRLKLESGCPSIIKVGSDGLANHDEHRVLNAETNITDEVQPGNDQEQTQVRGRRSRQSKLKAYEFIRTHLGITNDLDEEGEVTINLNQDRVKGFKDNCRKDDSDFENDLDFADQIDDTSLGNEDDDKNAFERKETTSTKELFKDDPQLVKKEGFSSDNRNSTRRNTSTRFFFAIDKTILINRCTLVKFSRNMLTCLEPDCNTTIQGSDFDAFRKMLIHIQDSHEFDYFTNTKERICPICQKAYHTAQNFRHHVMYDHEIIKRFLCEVCKKELRSRLGLKKHCLAYHREEYTTLEEISNNRPNVFERKKAVKLEDGEDLINNSVVNKLRNSHYTKTAADDAAGGKPQRLEKKAITNSEDYLTSCERRRKAQGIKTKTEIKTDAFFIIKDDILCRGGVFVKVSPEKLTCLGTDCSFIVEGSGSRVFKGMSRHINAEHANEDNGQCKTCPLCLEAFDKTEAFESHLLNNHSTEANCNRVMCPTCRIGVPYESFKEHSKLHRGAAKVSTWKEEEQFYVFGENSMWMMYKHSVFLRTATHFHCREEGCEGIINGSFHYSGFEEVRKHVDEMHSPSAHSEVHPVPCHRCPVCTADFKDGAILKAHIMREHKPKVVCPSCWKIMNHVRIHRWRHYSAEERASAIAAGEVDQFAEAKKRLKESGRIFSCPHCPKLFRTRALYRYHVPTHLPKELRKTWKCPEENCDAVLLSLLALRTHIERRHKPELVTRHLVCEICTKRFYFRDRNKYDVHMRSHRNERSFMCDRCPLRFVSLAQLQRHGKAHSTTRMYQCEYCAMSYKWPANLNRHRQSAHKDVVPGKSKEERLKHVPPEYRPDFIGPRRMYPCGWCDKPFQLQSRMKKHALVCPLNTK